MRLAVVLNSSAGTLAGMHVVDAVAVVERGFQEAGHEVTCVATPGEDIEKAISKAIHGDAEVVVVGGGDGTIATAARLLTRSDKALGILPLGTMNLLAKDLAIPLELEAAVAALAGGDIIAIDAGEVNGRPFLNNSVIGLYPRMVEERERTRAETGMRKWPAMGLAAWHALTDFKRLEVQVDFGEGPKRLKTPVLAVANNVYDDEFGEFIRRHSLAEGVLGVYVAKHRGAARFLRMAARLVLGGWQDDPNLEVYRAQVLTVHANRPKLRVANDGEIHDMWTPLHYRVLPGALKVLAPRKVVGDVAPEAEPVLDTAAAPPSASVARTA